MSDADSIIQLYPLPQKAMPLEGVYLGHELRSLGGAARETFIYSNYITSLDGRIAIPHPTKPGMVVPEQTANPRDWRLFQELAIQADILITSGRYLRDYAEGRAQEILRVHDEPRFADLKDWRSSRGLKPLPDLAVISGSLNFPIPEVLAKGDRSVLIFTISQADPERIKDLEKQAGKVIVAGETSVMGDQLAESLSDLGYKIIYNSTGPKVLHLLLAAGVLDRLYLTCANRILGGKPFSSVVEGDLLEPAVDFRLNTVYYDPVALDGLGQMLTSYDNASAR